MLLAGVLYLLLASERAQAKAQGATVAGLLTQIAQLRTELRHQEQLLARAVHEQHTARQESVEMRRYKEELLPDCQRAKSTVASAEAKALKELASARRSAEDAAAELQLLAEERDGHSSALLDATAQLRDCLTSARAHAHARRDKSAEAAPFTRSAAAATALLETLRGHTKHGLALAQQAPFRPQEVGEEDHQATDDASPPLPPSPAWEGEACMDVGEIADGGDVPSVKMRVFVNDGPGGAIDYSHMAMIAQTPPHCPWRWILMWQSSHGIEGTDDQHFRVAFSHDAMNWSAPLVMSLTEGGPVWGPVLHVHGDVMWLFYSESVVCKRARDPVADAEKPVRWCPGGDLKYVQSHDGVHWTSPVIIHPQAADGGVPKVVANQLVATPTGRWVLPFWSEPPRSEPSPECPSDAPHTSGVLLSDNQGRTWRPSAVIQDARTWLIEGTVAALRNGTLLQLFRTGLGAVFQSVSTDDGDTWSVPVPTPSLPNPNAKLNLIRLAGSDTLAVAYNHAGGPSPMPRFRSNLFVALSEDSGGSWHKVAALESTQTHATQWHYPTLAQDGCRLLVAYSSLHRYSSFGPEDVDDVVGGIHLAEVDLRRADVSPATALPDIDWFAPPVDEFDIEMEDLTQIAALAQQQDGNGDGEQPGDGER